MRFLHARNSTLRVASSSPTDSVDKRFLRRLTIGACPCAETPTSHPPACIDVISHFTAQLHRARASSGAPPFREPDVASSSSTVLPLLPSRSLAPSIVHRARSSQRDVSTFGSTSGPRFAGSVFPTLSSRIWMSIMGT